MWSHAEGDAMAMSANRRMGLLPGELRAQGGYHDENRSGDPTGHRVARAGLPGPAGHSMSRRAMTPTSAVTTSLVAGWRTTQFSRARE
jgi:hypothetical protein